MRLLAPARFCEFSFQHFERWLDKKGTCFLGYACFIALFIQDTVSEAIVPEDSRSLLDAIDRDIVEFQQGIEYR